MERIRMKMDGAGYHDLQPLGRPKPGRGAICEDLGHTQFQTTSSSRRSAPNKSSRQVPHPKDDNDTSEDDLDILSSKHNLSSSSQPEGRQKSKATKRSQVPKDTRRAGSGSQKRPKPRPSYQGANVGGENRGRFALERPPRAFLDIDEILTSNDMHPSNQLSLSKQRTCKVSAREDGYGTSPLEELSPNKAKRTKSSKKNKFKPDPFPMQNEYSAARSKKNSSHPTHREPAPFPMPVPSVASSRKRQLAPFPIPSPPNLQSRRVKATVTPLRRAPRRFPPDNDSSDNVDELLLTDTDNVIPAHRAPRPFPMSMPQFSPKVPNNASGSKRSAHGGEEQRVIKKSRPSSELDSFNDFSSLSLEGETNVDPSTICPYCDEPWPSVPSPTLISLLECTKRKSYADPRPGNALGLKAPLTAFVELCQRHRFEMTHLPLALTRGWPTRLDFASLPKRVKAFMKELRCFINMPDKSLFWREIRDDVKEVGRMKVVSVSGQYATFERTQPGYYGEQGSIIIHQSLYSLFPPDGIPEASVHPLTPDQFLTRVLVPETAILLIQEDMGLSTKEEALCVLEESKKYGVAMFPEQAQGDDVAEVGEQLARERARMKRKLLEERGEADADVKRQVEKERRQIRKVLGKEREQSDVKGKGKEKASDTYDESGEEEDRVSRKDKRKTKNPATEAVNDVTPKASHQRWDENAYVQTLDSKDQSTPGPAGTTKSLKQSSTTSRRSRRSPSTSSDDRMQSRPTSQLYEPVRKPSSRDKQPMQKGQPGSQWVFNFRDGSSSSDREDVDIDEMIAEREGRGKATEAIGSNSDIVIVETDPTPKSRSKPCKIVRGTVHSETGESDSVSDAFSRTATSKRRTKTSGHIEANIGGNGVRVNDVLGQTKRRKKGKAKDNAARSDAETPSSSYSWLLNDFE